MISRRNLVLGSVALVAAPSIVRAASLMPVSVLNPLPLRIQFAPVGWWSLRSDVAGADWRLVWEQVAREVWGESPAMAALADHNQIVATPL